MLELWHIPTSGLESNVLLGTAVVPLFGAFRGAVELRGGQAPKPKGGFAAAVVVAPSVEVRVPAVGGGEDFRLADCPLEHIAPGEPRTDSRGCPLPARAPLGKTHAFLFEPAMLRETARSRRARARAVGGAGEGGRKRHARSLPRSPPPAPPPLLHPQVAHEWLLLRHTCVALSSVRLAPRGRG